MMIAILTGDIVDSQQVDSKLWLKDLKSVLRRYGKSPESWEIFRGDMFQLEVEAKDAILAAIVIKSHIKTYEKLDVRIAIGVGISSYRSKKITESNGEAYTNSGRCFEGLKRNRLSIVTPWPKDIDTEINLYLLLASLTMDSWTPATADTMAYALLHPDYNQATIAKKLKKSQSTISANLNRAGYDEILKMINRYEGIISTKLNKI